MAGARKQKTRYCEYNRSGYNRTLYGKVLVRAHNSRTRWFVDCWWNEFFKGWPRDQLSMRYCVQAAHVAAGFRAHVIGTAKHDSMWAPYFKHLGRG